jgi:hypothetical protein
MQVSWFALVMATAHATARVAVGMLRPENGTGRSRIAKGGRCEIMISEKILVEICFFSRYSFLTFGTLGGGGS